MSNEPKHLRDRDRAWGKLRTVLDDAYLAAVRSGYEMGREDERNGAPHQFNTQRAASDWEPAQPYEVGEIVDTPEGRIVILPGIGATAGKPDTGWR